VSGLLVLKLAFRNLTRNTRRTLITGVTVALGVSVSVLGWGLVDGLDENALRAARTVITGDVLLRPQGYPRDGMEWPLAMAKRPSDGLLAAIEAAGAGAPRAVAQARLVRGSEAIRALVVGWSPGQETLVFSRDGWKLEGRWPEAGARPDGGGIVLGSGVAKSAGIGLGEPIVMEVRTAAGAINALPFTVTGLVTTDNAGADNTSAWVRMEDAETLLQLDGARTHLAVRLRDPEDAATLIAAAKAQGWEGFTTREEVSDLLSLNDLRRRALALLVGIVMAIAATGIANTVIMSVYERVREIGTLMALGLRRSQVRALFLWEGAALGVVAGSVGAGFGALLVLHFEGVGIQLGEAVARAGGDVPMSAVLYTRFRWEPLLGALAFGVGVSVAAAIWPARHASRLHPADATRAS
jgi:putative ABC transport system permease protein